MLEKDMEELIAKYPLDFFPRNDFTLIGRQGSFSGVGRYDLLFQDTRGLKILMELKARPAKYQDADQLAKYHDALKLRGEKNILLWLVATNIPHSIREFLDNVGIEHTEIHENEYNRIAEKYEYKFKESEPPVLELVTPNLQEKIIIPRQPNTSSNFRRSSLTRDFRDSLGKMGSFFSTAYDFINGIINTKYNGFWLSTAKNAHIYYQDAYYIYMKLSFTKIELHSRFNGRIDTRTKDNSRLLFINPLKNLITELGGFSHGWATMIEDGVSLTSKTPAEFFEKMAELIVSVHK